MDRVTNIIMFSGGFDSTYLLYDYLRRNKKIYVHHIILKNSFEDRWKEELDATRKIVKLLKEKYGYEFDYTESEYSMNFDAMNGVNWDMDIVIFTAAQIVAQIEGIVRVVYARVKEDDLSYHSKKQVPFTQGIWEASTAKFKDRVVKEVHMPYRNRWKKDLVKDIPRELLELSWSCMYPIDGKRCYNCKSCIYVENAFNGNTNTKNNI